MGKTQVFDIEAAKERLLDFYDADQLVDVLNISSEEILDRFPEKIEEYLSEDTFGQTELPFKTNDEDDPGEEK
jgi:hypothetical protein